MTETDKQQIPQCRHRGTRSARQPDGTYVRTCTQVGGCGKVLTDEQYEADTRIVMENVEAFECGRARRDGFVPGGPFHGSEGGQFWQTGRWYPEEHPELQEIRTCSYDGGVHPVDALMLIRKGYTLGMTDKSYKAYMHSPDGKEPTPPLKVYVHHFAPEQLAELNKAERFRG